MAALGKHIDSRRIGKESMVCTSAFLNKEKMEKGDCMSSSSFPRSIFKSCDQRSNSRSAVRSGFYFSSVAKECLSHSLFHLIRFIDRDCSYFRVCWQRFQKLNWRKLSQTNLAYEGTFPGVGTFSSRGFAHLVVLSELCLWLKKVRVSDLFLRRYRAFSEFSL
jgi:hypothetical protein